MARSRPLALSVEAGAEKHGDDDCWNSLQQYTRSSPFSSRDAFPRTPSTATPTPSSRCGQAFSPPSLAPAALLAEPTGQASPTELAPTLLQQANEDACLSSSKPAIRGQTPGMAGDSIVEELFTSPSPQVSSGSKDNWQPPQAVKKQTKARLLFSNTSRKLQEDLVKMREGNAKESEARIVAEWSKKVEESEAKIVAEWSKKVEDLQQREQELTAEGQAALLREQLDAFQRESDLKAEHADVEAKLLADARAQKEEFESKLKQQQEIRTTLEKTLEDERAHFKEQEEGWTSQINQVRDEVKACKQSSEETYKQFSDEVKAREQSREKAYKAQVRNVETSASSKAKQLEENAAQTLAEVRRAAEQREAELTRRNEELNQELESATESSKCREDNLSSELKQASAKCKQLQEDFMSTCKQRDSQQQELAEVRHITQQRANELSKQNEQLALKAKQSEKDLNEKLKSAAESSKRREEELKSTCDQMHNQEQMMQLEMSSLQTALKGEIANEKQAFAALKAEHTTTLEHAEQQRELLSELQSTHANSQTANKELQRDLSVSVADRERLREALAEEQASLQKQREQLEGVSGQYAKSQADLMTAQAGVASSNITCECLSRENRELQLENGSLKEHSTTSNQLQIQAITDLKMSVDQLSVKVDSQKGEIANKANDIVNHQLSMRSLEEQLAAAELSRRELRNTIQELKGNIRVMCRVRPAEDPELACSLTQTSESKLSLSHAGGVYPYTFDHVFGTGSTQEQLFDEVSGLVQSALDGYKVCIFAYGQTGSGKTFTMQGKTEQDSWGLIPRSLRQIFNEAEVMRSKGWEWTLKASFIEVYNEVLRDLLRDDAPVGPQCHTIKHDADWGMVVTNATCIEVTGMNHINSLMAKAAKMRAVGSTDMNAQSSRSHSIFALYLTGVHRELNSELHGALHLVDLAGSERLDKSGAVGERLRETQNINKSLSSLADVFAAKAEGRSHVPFRNSKLTHLMEPCLSGQGKTLMFVNVGPEADNSHETMCSLRFAGQVSQCTTGGKPRRAAKPASRPPSASASSSGLAPAGSSNRRR